MFRLEAAIERVVERMMAVHDAELAREAEANKVDPKERDRAFAALVTSPNFDQDLEVFDQLYPGYFARRTAQMLRERANADH